MKSQFAVIRVREDWGAHTEQVTFVDELNQAREFAEDHIIDSDDVYICKIIGKINKHITIDPEYMGK
jgi:hypothetical protein